MPARTAEQRLSLVHERWPETARLARILSLAVRIEPSLLRAARLAAGLDAAAEADLWFSGLMASSGTLGVSFGPAVAEALRRELTALPDERALAWSLVTEHHGRQPWSIRLEERINYLTTGPPAEASEIEDLLAAALSELYMVRARDEQAALGIARWLLAALARAPAVARATPTAAAAELAAAVQLDGRLGGADQLTRAENSELLPWLLDHLGTTVLPVRLLPGAVALGGDPPDGIPLPVPATDPLVVSVIWGSGPSTHHEHVRVTPGEELSIRVEETEVELRTLTGGGVVLSRAGIGRILVNGIDQGAGFAVADYAILTAADVLGDWALHSGGANIPSRSFASEAPALAAESSGDAGDGPSGSGPVPEVVYVPEGGEPMNVGVVASDTGLDVVLLEPERPVPAVLPVGQIQPGQRWRLQALPEREPADSRQSADVPAASIRGLLTAGDARPQFMPTERTGSLRGHAGAAITLENPWGAVIGLLLAEAPELSLEIAGQGRTEEGTRHSSPLGSLRVAPIDAIVARFNLARQITPAAAALVDGKWRETQPLEDLVALPLRNGALPVLADVEPGQLGFSPEPSVGTITPALQSVLAASAFVLFTGATRAPSWEAYRAVRAELQEARLLVPTARPGTLMALTTHPDLAAYPERVVVWLDDLPRYLAEGGLDSLVLSHFEGQHRAVLIGTISEADLDRLRSDTPQPGPIQQLLYQATVISLVREEQDTASQAEPDAKPPGQDGEGSDLAQASALAEAAVELARAGDRDRAVALVRTITNPAARDTALRQLAVIFVRAGEPDQAQSLVYAITGSDAQADALAEVAVELARAGDRDRAVALVRTITNPVARYAAVRQLAQAVTHAFGIFISYRRQDSSHLAARLHDRLADHFGGSRVFVDVDTIETGVDFAEEITRAVTVCTVLLAIIGPNWLTATDQRGRRRLDDPDDFVRLEIETALARGLWVIPILTQGAVMPSQEDLPESLAGLARRNAVPIRNESFRSDAERLVADIERTLTPAPVFSTLYANTVFVNRGGAVAVLRNDGTEQIRDVIIEAQVDLDRLRIPFGLTLADFQVEVIPARIPLGDLPPAKSVRIDLLHWSDTRFASSHQEGGPWTAAKILFERRPKPYVPPGMDDETVDAALAQVRKSGSAADHIHLQTYESLMAGLGNGFKSNNDRLRFVYENLLPISADISRALVDLSVYFIDLNGYWWRRHEDGSLEIIALAAGQDVVIEDTQPFTLHYGFGDPAYWTGVTEMDSKSWPFGMNAVTLTAATLAGQTRLDFIRRYGSTWDPNGNQTIPILSDPSRQLRQRSIKPVP